MIVSSGRLDQRIRIQQKTVARDELGGHAETWSDLATVWAETLDLNGKEMFSAKAIGSAVNERITIRYRTDVKADMRVMHQDGSLARIEWIRHVTRKEFMELFCIYIDG